MKKHSWLSQSLPVIVLCTTCFWILQCGRTGKLHSDLYQSSSYKVLESFDGWFTNQKFHYRGRRAPHKKIIIAAIDSSALQKIGRWPWHRDIWAKLIETLVQNGTQVIGVDLLFSENDVQVPPLAKEIIRSCGKESNIDFLDTDGALARTIHTYSDRLVFGMMSGSPCQPAFNEISRCLPIEREVQKNFESQWRRFAISKFEGSSYLDASASPLYFLGAPILNIPRFQSETQHMGFSDFLIDPDGVMRKVPLVKFYNGVPIPSFGLEVARLSLKDEVELSLDKEGRISNLELIKSKNTLQTTPLGDMQIAFHGPMFTFPHVSVADVLDTNLEVKFKINGQLAWNTSAIDTMKKTDFFKDAIVLIGWTSSLYDQKAYPFSENGSNVGVEGQAEIIENILGKEELIPGTTFSAEIILTFVLTVCALFFAFLIDVLPSVQALFIICGLLCAFFLFDFSLLFTHQSKNWSTVFVYIEFVFVAVLMSFNKYILEEKKRRDITRAFSRFVSPEVVKAIAQSPEKLVLGGAKKELSILFMDIRNFTQLSEKMEPEKLISFLKDFLGAMSKIVIEKGTIDKYIGDSIMAFWGAPLDQKEHAFNACEAAAKMIHSLTSLNAHLKAKYGIEIKIGIGIHTGPVTVGNLGSEQMVSYTAIGDTVNTASRIEQLTKYYHVGILTTRETFNSILESGCKVPEYRVIDIVKVRGKSEAIELIEVISQNANSDVYRAYNQAREYYKNKKFSEAIHLLNKTASTDGPSLILLERCKLFQSRPPAIDWDGHWEFSAE